MNPSATATSKQPRRRQRGAAAIEMALLLPLLCLILDGVVEFGLILHDQSVLNSATSVAARAGIAAGTGKLTSTQIAAVASQYCSDGLISIGATSPPVITVTQTTDPVYKTPLRVTAHYDFKGLLVGGLIAAMAGKPHLSATTVMYNE